MQGDKDSLADEWEGEMEAVKEERLWGLSANGKSK